MLLVVAAVGVADTFYIEPSSEARARAADGEQRVAVCAVLLLLVAGGFALVRMRWSALVAAASATVFLVATSAADTSVLTYAMVPAAAVAGAASLVVDLTRR